MNKKIWITTIFSKRILLYTLIGAILATIASTFFYCRELGVTTMGDFGPQEAARMGISTDSYCGWPTWIFPWIPSLVPGSGLTVDRLLGSFFANGFGFTLFLFGVIPNLLFWGSVCFVLINVVRLLKLWLKVSFKI